MPSQFPRVEEIVLSEFLREKLDSKPFEDLLRLEEVHMQHSYLRAVGSTRLSRWNPPLDRREDKERIEELTDLADVELRRLYQGLLSAESREKRTEAEKIAMIAENLTDSLDTYVLGDVITKPPLVIEYNHGLTRRSKPARLFHMYLRGLRSGLGNREVVKKDLQRNIEELERVESKLEKVDSKDSSEQVKNDLENKKETIERKIKNLQRDMDNIESNDATKKKKK